MPLVSPCSSPIPSPLLARANPTVWAKPIPEPPWCWMVSPRVPSCDGPGVRMQNCCPTQVMGPVWMYSPVSHPAMGARAVPWAQHHQLLYMSPNYTPQWKSTVCSEIIGVHGINGTASAHFYSDCPGHSRPPAQEVREDEGLGVKKSPPKSTDEKLHTEQLDVSLLPPLLPSLIVHQDHLLTLTQGHIHPLTSKPTCPQGPCTAARALEETTPGGTWRARSCPGLDRNGGGNYARS